ncbi:E3 ubiquitin-protein ligase synoviolin [Hondaea fermentalgiana]|uniref:RING-type E3 ubiquitin transferase n=1 Tax=Hondaea fermentalgiana TaxID=2315210 RepID=A0A2R5GAL9_9STRA|nr:E3 ubiquitin-protein ligase synoviolin [Hondaea fermentalgiana]|eukprot:GBG27645.1 E3 ubiquitin-protein ligase synoviolin [Hondaea fermentalgiana]
MRFTEYAIASTLVTAGVVSYAYMTRVQFYPAVIYLVTSKPAIMVLGNMAFVFTIALGQLTNKIFLGRLREVEREIIWENLRYAFTETCLALSTFREEMSLNVVIMFTALLFAKVFHWLCEARVEHLEQAQETSRLAHARTGPSVQVFFGFEYILLAIKVMEVFIKYCLAAIDMHFIQGQWYNKSLYELYLKLFIDMAQLIVNMIFFAIIFTYYGVPLHLMRQLYIAAKNVHDRLSHFWRFRQITANLHDSFQSATEEDLEATDRVCIICREEMVAATGIGAPKKLGSCGHIFHFYCLRNWLERQLKCPTCRTDIPWNQAQRNNIRPAAADNNVGNGGAEARGGGVGGGNADVGRDRNQRPENEADNDRAQPPQAAPVGQAPAEEGNAQGGLPWSGASQSRLRSPPPFGFPMGLGPTGTVTGAPVAGGELPSVAQYLQSQIEILQLQLQVYQAQANAAHATRRAALAAMRAREFHARQQHQHQQKQKNDNEEEGEGGGAEAEAEAEEEGVPYSLGHVSGDHDETAAEDDDAKEAPPLQEEGLPVPAPGFRDEDLASPEAPRPPLTPPPAPSRDAERVIEEDAPPREDPALTPDGTQTADETGSASGERLSTPQQELRLRLAAAAMARSQNSAGGGESKDE